MTDLPRIQKETLQVLEASTGMRWRVLPMDAKASPKDIPEFLIANMPIFSLNMDVAAPNGAEFTAAPNINRKQGSKDYMYAMRFDDTHPPREETLLVRTIAAVRDLMVTSGALHKGDMQAIHHLKDDGKPSLVDKVMVMHGIALPAQVAEDKTFLTSMTQSARTLIGELPHPVPAAQDAEPEGNFHQITHVEKANCEKLRKATGLNWTVVDMSKQNHEVSSFIVAPVVDVYADKNHVAMVNPAVSDLSKLNGNRYYLLDVSKTPQIHDEFFGAQAQIRNVVHKLGMDKTHPPFLGGYDMDFSEKLGEATKNGAHNRLLLPASLVEAPEFQAELNQQLRGKVLLTSLNVNTPYKGRN